MAEKDDRENLGDDLGQRLRQFLLELSSALQDRVPSPGIMFAWMMPYNDTISHMIFSFLLLTVSEPAEKGPRWSDKEVSVTSKIGYVHHTTYQRRIPKPQISQSFLQWIDDDPPRQEDAQ